jgi:hypothetical protein
MHMPPLSCRVVVPDSTATHPADDIPDAIVIEMAGAGPRDTACSELSPRSAVSPRSNISSSLVLSPRSALSPRSSLARASFSTTQSASTAAEPTLPRIAALPYRPPTIAEEPVAPLRPPSSETSRDCLELAVALTIFTGASIGLLVDGVRRRHGAYGPTETLSATTGRMESNYQGDVAESELFFGGFFGLAVLSPIPQLIWRGLRNLCRE